MSINFSTDKLSNSTTDVVRVICLLEPIDDEIIKLYKKGERYYFSMRCLEEEGINLEIFEECILLLAKKKSIKSIGFDDGVIDRELIDILIRHIPMETKISIFLGTKKVKTKSPPKKAKSYNYNDFENFTLEISENYKGWKDFFRLIKEEGILPNLASFLRKESETQTIFPPIEQVYTAFDLCPLEKMKVCIVGQDPYHTPGAAMGLAFSHNPERGIIQPSLTNIFLELQNEGYTTNNTGDLSKWANEGVFLINTALTVRSGVAGSHSAKTKRGGSGWYDFSDALFRYINRKKEHIVVVLWGGHAQSFRDCFSKSKHRIIESVHPSPLSCHGGFFGSKPFTRSNIYLEEWGMEPIDWNLS